MQRHNFVTQGGKNRSRLVGAESNLNNGRCILSTVPKIVIECDASKSGWGAVCQGQSAGGPWSQEGRREHINFLELKAAHMTVLVFAERLKPESIHLQMDNQAALAYIRKMGGRGRNWRGGGEGAAQ